MVDQSADLVTKEFLRAELAELNLGARFAEVDTRSAQLEHRLTVQISALAVQTAQGFTGVANDFRRQQSWMIGTVISAGVLLVAALGLLVKLAFFS